MYNIFYVRYVYICVLYMGVCLYIYINIFIVYLMYVKVCLHCSKDVGVLFKETWEKETFL
jgi:hypothetical protein